MDPDLTFFIISGVSLVAAAVLLRPFLVDLWNDLVIEVLWLWQTRVRSPLCDLGIVGCPYHRAAGEISATWMDVDWSGPLDS